MSDELRKILKKLITPNYYSVDDATKDVKKWAMGLLPKNCLYIKQCRKFIRKKIEEG